MAFLRVSEKRVEGIYMDDSPRGQRCRRLAAMHPRASGLSNIRNRMGRYQGTAVTLLWFPKRAVENGRVLVRYG